MRQAAFEENFIEVAIIDDHALFRQSLKKALLYHGQIKVGIEASDYSELLDKLSISKIEIIIMDLFMPHLTKTKDTIRQIQQFIPDAKILILTMQNDEYIKRELINCGIYSFISKSADFDQFIENIIMAAEGVPAKFDLPDAKANNNGKQTGKLDFKSSVFSEREKLILELISRGKTNVEISRTIFLSVRSIEQIRRKMKERVNVENTASLINFAIRNRIIE